MRQFLALIVIVAVFGMTSAMPHDRKEVEHVLAETLKGDGANPHDFEKEAKLLNDHLSEDNLHLLVHQYVEMTDEQQESFKEKLVEGGKVFVNDEKSGHVPNSGVVKEFVKKAVLDSKQ